MIEEHLLSYHILLLLPVHVFQFFYPFLKNLQLNEIKNKTPCCYNQMISIIIDLICLFYFCTYFPVFHVILYPLCYQLSWLSTLISVKMVLSLLLLFLIPNLCSLLSKYFLIVCCILCFFLFVLLKVAEKISLFHTKSIFDIYHTVPIGFMFPF